MNSLKVIFHCCNKNFKRKYFLKSQLPLFFKSRHHYCTLSLNKLNVINSDKDDFEYYKKIIYSDVLKRKNKLEKEKPHRDGPIFLKYLLEDKNEVKHTEESTKEDSETHFPYSVNSQFINVSEEEELLNSSFSKSVLNMTPSDNEKITLPQWHPVEKPIDRKNLEDPETWAMEDETLLVSDWMAGAVDFGTCDPNEPVSSVPCGGCGAHLHCKDISVPGFLPKEVFKGKTEDELRSEICQRCHFLKEFNVALGVNVSDSEYPKIISQIKYKKALVILMIDLLDFPCSIWPGIMDLIGYNKQILIVGNKVDLFIQEGRWFLKHLKKCLLDSLEEQGVNVGNVKHVHLISAKTGFGIEALIDILYNNWSTKGDVYLVGCTNVGKSTLFNALIQSDYCKVKATEIMQRATISQWPGTTLNLLRFPIKRYTGEHLMARIRRLKELKEKKKILEEFIIKSRKIRLEQIPLQDFVEATFKPNTETDEPQDLFCNEMEKQLVTLDPNDNDLQGKWCFDTPGVVHHDQIVSLLTTSELFLTLPKNILIPRNFKLKPGTSLFIGGLARLDYVDGGVEAWFTVYASKELPVTITKLEDADLVYEKFLGSNLFRVPCGGKERLNKWPKLLSKKIQICGKIMNEADADIVLSSAGWVSVCVASAYRCKIEAWTPEGRGIYVRRKPVILYGHTFRGPRIRGTPAYKVIMKQVEGPTVKDELPEEI